MLVLFMPLESVIDFVRVERDDGALIVVFPPGITVGRLGSALREVCTHAERNAVRAALGLSPYEQDPCPSVWGDPAATATAAGWLAGAA